MRGEGKLNKKPLISIIVPVYNVEKYLSKCVDALLTQTYDNLEIILVDDGSTDSSGMLCDIYGKENINIYVIHKKNGGLSDARNAALDICKGEYITCVDSDDIVTNDYVETLYQGIEKYNCKISIGEISTFYDEKEWSNVKIDENNTWELLSSGDALKTILVQGKFDVSACSKLYARELFEGIRYPLKKWYEDLGTTYKLIGRTTNIAWCGKVIYGYRRNRVGSITTMKTYNPKVLEIIEMYEGFYRYIQNEYPHLIREANCRYATCAAAVLERLYISKEEKEFKDTVVEMRKLIRSRYKDILRSTLSLRRKMKLFIASLSGCMYRIIYRMYYT